LTCIPLDSDQTKLIQELTGVIKPNEILYVNDLLINSNQRHIDRYEYSNRKPYGVFEDNEGAILRHHAIDYLHKAIFTNFDILHEKTFEVVTMNGNRSKSIRIIGKKLTKAATIISARYRYTV
jgi:hypothetical protein